MTVNPFTVNRSMKQDDNSPEKSDLKEPKTMALLVKDGRDSTSGQMLLKEVSLPQDILKIGAGGIYQIWCAAKVRAARIKRAQTLIEAIQNSIGLEAGEAARLEIWVLVNDYILKEEQQESVRGADENCGERCMNQHVR